MKILAVLFYTCLISLALPNVIGCATKQKGEKVGTYVDDSVITTKVKTQLLAEPKLKSYEIAVETYRGVVQLSGFVTSKDDIKRAVEIARRVKGVSEVKNDMQLKDGSKTY